MFNFTKTSSISTLLQVVILLWFICILVISMTEVSSGLNAPSIQVNLQPVLMPPYEPAPFISTSGRTMVPLRAVTEAMNASVDWHAPTQTITIRHADTHITLVPGEPWASINGIQLPLDTPATIVNGRTFVPLRFVAESTGADIQWDPVYRLIAITTGPVIEAVVYEEAVYILPTLPSAHITITNPLNEEAVVWLGHSLLNPLHQWIDIPAVNVSLAAQETQTILREIDYEHISPNELLSGPYTSVFAIWDKDPSSPNAQRLYHWQQPEAFRLYRQQENFDALDPKIWFSRSGQLGRSSLNPQNVTVQNGMLQIRLPRSSLQGGELQTQEKLHYGSFEASMKLPNAPSSITGFFLYQAPDFDHEIDIEVYNRKDSEVMFTTYADGAVRREVVFPLAFDPTESFHQYRFDYTPQAVTFYINNQLMQTWTDGYSHEPMYLMINAWHPRWLDGTPPDRDQYLWVEWLRY
ncbi:stalk domain-containing protein [Anoxynatronum sibiricum]|uniref:Beta-glucanase n=1 Tax=Anoxynatronum sibiricum TaxID=210623 RepID=A0ABU9VNW3_9CLOT